MFDNFSIHSHIKKLVASKPGVPLRDINKPHKAGKICCGCAKNSKFTDVPFLRCSRCKAVHYCSQRCQKLDWIGKGAEGTPTRPRKHKDLCSELHATKEEFRNDIDLGEAIRTAIFGTWANQHDEESGVFYLHEFLAIKKVLGQSEVGFWAMPDVATPWSTGADHTGFRNGRMLLNESFPSMKKGWTKALRKDEYPFSPPSISVPGGRLESWKKYLEYRNIAATSISPLLLTNVLTVYQMLNHELQPFLGGKKELKVLVLGPEVELNQIPLFSELVYLMPNIDLELTFVSPATKAICDEARTRPKSLIKKSSHILDVRAPSDLGNGRVRIKLDSSQEYLHYAPNFESDAAVGLNAGLASYEEWHGTMHMLLMMRIPFSFSECTKLSLRYAELLWLPSTVKFMNAKGEFARFPRQKVPKVNIKLNPFHGVVNRDLAAVRVPNISNGYLMTISAF